MSKDVHYFSNGTEHEIWSRHWCDRCVNDHDYSHTQPWYEPIEAACPHIAAMFIGQEIPVMVEVPYDTKYGTLTDWHCLDFRRCSCDRGPDDPGEEPPPPIDPNQTVLFDADVLAPGVPRGIFLDNLPSEVSA